MIQGIPKPIPSPPPDNQPTPPVGDPVDPSTGLFVYSKTDLYLPDIISIDITRTYRQSDPTTRAFGVGTNFPYEIFLTSTNNYLDADLVLPDGSHIHYVCNNPNGCLSPTTEYTHTSSPSAFYGSRLVYSPQGAFRWDLILQDGTVFRFGDMGPLQWIKDRHGNKLRICRATANGDPCESGYGDITRIISPSGRWVNFTYDSSHRITQIRDNIGRTVSYTYNAAGDLWKVTDVKNGITEFTYDTNHQMKTIKDARNIVYLTNDYDANGRVSLQTLANGGEYQFNYTLDTQQSVIQTDATDPRGFVRRTTFDSKGYTTEDKFAVVTCSPKSAHF